MREEEVCDLEIDLYNYNDYYSHNQVFHDSSFDFEVFTRYVDEHDFHVIVRRLDSQAGWHHDLKVLIVYLTAPANCRTQIVKVGASGQFEKVIPVHVDFTIKGMPARPRLPTYSMVEPNEPVAITREEFNNIFDAQLVCLPPELYAVGLHQKKVYMYNTKFSMYYEILRSIKHIIRVALTYRPEYAHFYFVIDAHDGYMEGNYLSSRTKAKQVSEYEYEGKTSIIMDNPEEYPVFHKNGHILAQTIHIGFPDAIAIPNRFFFYCDLYNPFRSFHRGLEFRQKVNKMVFASRKERGSKYNFFQRRDIEVNQREYLYTAASVNRDNLILSDRWIFDHEMVNYRYILDVDGIAGTWDATAWKLNSGSVIFKVKSCWTQWFSSEYLEWIHYVPIKDDFSDLQDKYLWCESHLEECEQIIRNAKQLFQKVYRYHHVVQYTLQVLDTIVERQERSSSK